MYTHRGLAMVQNPFTAYVDIEVDDAFFGAGYIISSFLSLYDMFGKFMAGLDIEVLYDQIFESTVNTPEVNALVAAESAMMDDDIETNSLPRLQTGLRDMNSVLSSTFIIGKALIEDAKAKALSKFSAGLKYALIPAAQARWSTHLEWNKGVVGVYAEIMKFYFSTKVDTDEINYSMAAKEALWPFTLLDFERAALGTLQGASNSKENVAGASMTSRVIGGALSGAAMGAMAGSHISATSGASLSSGVGAGASYAGAGAVVGAVLGAAAAYYY
jgi:hypothetical protein